MARNLVTGGNGFIGRHLVRSLLDHGDEVVCLNRSKGRDQPTAAVANLEHVYADARDRNAVQKAIQGADRIFHLAAAVATRSLAESRSINVEGTTTIAEAAAKLETPPQLVYVSSLAAAGPGPAPAIESGECRPVSHYGRTKLEAEIALRSYADRLPITIVRPPCVFGDWDRNLLALYQTVRMGWDFIVSTDSQYSYLHVTDLVTGLLTAAERGQRLKAGEDRAHEGLYYMTDPQAVTFPQLADMIAKSMDRKNARHVRIPVPICWMIGAVGEAMLRGLGRKTFLNLDKIREGLGGSWVCDASRAGTELGFATAASLTERIAQTTAFYKSMKWL